MRNVAVVGIVAILLGAGVGFLTGTAGEHTVTSVSTNTTTSTAISVSTYTSTSTVTASTARVTTTAASTTAQQGPAATLIEGEPLVVSVNGQEFLNMTLQNNLSREELTMLTALWKNSSSGVTVAESSALIDMKVGEVANGYIPLPSITPGTYYVGVWASSTDNQPLSIVVSFQISL